MAFPLTFAVPGLHDNRYQQGYRSHRYRRGEGDCPVCNRHIRMNTPHSSTNQEPENP